MEEGAAIRASIPCSATVAEAPESAMKPSAVSVGMAGIERLRRGEYAGTGISPLYIQRTAAELKQEESGGLSPVALRQERVASKVKARAAARNPSVRARIGERKDTGVARLAPGKAAASEEG